jgi:Ca2+-binding RTX toxin-like protein
MATRSNRITIKRAIRALVPAAALIALAGAGEASAATQTFTNPNPITIPQQGNGVPFPSTIAVSGLNGPITDVNAAWSDFSHFCQADVDALLVSPGGQKSILLSDSGRCEVEGEGPFVVDNGFDDEAGIDYPCQTDPSGTFRPTDDACGANPDDFTFGGGPAGPYSASLAQFDGGVANGTWSLYVLDDSEGDIGSIASWSLTLTTQDPSSTTTPEKCFGEDVTIAGTTAPETISGTAGPDVINASGGNDVVRAIQEDDVVCGGRGRDRLFGGADDDVLIGGEGKDRLVGGGGNDRLFGGTPGAPPDKATDFCGGGGGSDKKSNCEKGGAS